LSVFKTKELPGCICTVYDTYHCDIKEKNIKENSLDIMKMD
jgi:hypothetical protein